MHPPRQNSRKKRIYWQKSEKSLIFQNISWFKSWATYFWIHRFFNVIPITRQQLPTTRNSLSNCFRHLNLVTGNYFLLRWNSSISGIFGQILWKWSLRFRSWNYIWTWFGSSFGWKGSNGKFWVRSCIRAFLTRILWIRVGCIFWCGLEVRRGEVSLKSWSQKLIIKHWKFCFCITFSS